MNRDLKRGFAALEMLYWITYGSFTTYIVSMLVDGRGASASLAGLMLAVFMASACLGQYVMGLICDRRQNNRVVFMISMALIAVVQIGIYFAPGYFWMALGCAALGFIQPPNGAILDTWLIRSFPDEPGAYAPIRAWGSLAYAGLMAGMGALISVVGYGAMPVVSGILAMCTIAAAWMMPEIPKNVDSGDKAVGGGMRLSAAVWLFIIGLGVLGVGTIPELNMMQMIVEDVGGTVMHVGIATAFNTVAEFLIMRFGGGLSRVDPGRRLIASCVMYVLATGLILLSGNVWMLYAAFFVNGLAYGILLPARRAMAEQIAPPQAHNRVHALGDMACLNFGGLVGNQASGIIMDRVGVPFFLILCGITEAAALGLMGMLKRAAGRRAALTTDRPDPGDS